MTFPEWWDWELDFDSHVEDRMEERGFTEVDLRAMLEYATHVTPARRRGRWLAWTRFGGIGWVVVVEPDGYQQILHVITAYSSRS
jgi:hypothetical protein